MGPTCLFQFLIGTLKTFDFLNEIVASDQVSIPHRYSKNEKSRGISKQADGFQFLIGTLKTMAKSIHHKFYYDSFNSS